MPRRFSPGRCCCRSAICPVCHPDFVPPAFRVDFPVAPTDLGCGDCAAWFSSFEAEFCGYNDPDLCAFDTNKECVWVYRGGPCPDPFDPTWESGIFVSLFRNVADIDVTIFVASDIHSIPKLCDINCGRIGNAGFQYKTTLVGAYGGNCRDLIQNLVVPADIFLDSYNGSTSLCQFGPLVPATPGVVDYLTLTALAA